VDRLKVADFFNRYFKLILFDPFKQCTSGIALIQRNLLIGQPVSAHGNPIQ